MISKFKLLLISSVLGCVTVGAQVRTEISLRDLNNSAYGVGEQGYNSHNYSVGFGIGSSKLYGDLAYSNPQPVYIGYFEKNISHAVSIGWTVSVGDLSTRDPYTFLRSFNHFTSVDQHITVQLGSVFNLVSQDYYDNILFRYIGGVYGGVGLGIINNDIKRIANKDFSAAPGAIQLETPSILTNTTGFYVPVNVGYNLYIPKLLFFKGCVFNANFQYSAGMTDFIDGYKPLFTSNKKNDVFTVMSVGFRFYIMQPAEY
jgi:hypothetical protein